MIAHNESVTSTVNYASQRIVILGAGPGGYEAALVAASSNADVTIIERNALGGSAVLTDVVPSKTLIATADMMTRFSDAGRLGIENTKGKAPQLQVDMNRVNSRVLDLAHQQSADIKRALASAGVKIISGTGKLTGPHTVAVTDNTGLEYDLHADFILLSVGTHPREMATGQPDGERILTWTQLYNLREVPRELIVIGSGVTGAEFASAYNGLGSQVTLISSRDRVLPGEDEDAARVLEGVFERRGVRVMPRSRASAVERTDDGVVVTLSDGRKVSGTHCLVAIGSIPNTEGLGLETAGVETNESGYVVVDAVSRTSVPHIYAAGDCTGVYPLASVAAMQGRIAMAHLLGDVVHPLRTDRVAANIFTTPEIATVGISEKDLAAGVYRGEAVMLPLTTNPRAKMMAFQDGFVKVFARKHSGTVIGGVVVGPRASELIYPIALAIEKKLTVDDLAATFAVYPSLSEAISTASRQLHTRV